MTSYADLLRDPRWQKRRLEILNRDEFTCQSCFDSERTLHVHHCHYAKGCNPWDYPDGWLLTLCEDCHARETESSYSAKRRLLEAVAACGWLSSQIVELAEAIRAANVSGRYEPGVTAICWGIGNADARAQGLDHFWIWTQERASALREQQPQEAELV
jgi:hypothetical protein